MWRKCGNLESYLYYPWMNEDHAHCGVRFPYMDNLVETETCAALLGWPSDGSIPSNVTPRMLESMGWPDNDPLLNIAADEWVDVRMYVRLNLSLIHI